jgi:hypothetical protein
MAATKFDLVIRLMMSKRSFATVLHCTLGAAAEQRLR